ncbi:MAG: reprolysin-like metallopeptidase, partial [Glaciecola sp.]
MNKIIVSFFIAALFFLSPVHASTNLWSVTSQSELKNTSLKLSEPTQEFPTHIQQLRHNAEVVLLNKPLLRGLSVGDTIQLPIDNEIYNVKLTKFKAHSNGSVTWYGGLSDGKDKLPVIITYGDTNFYVRAVTPTGTFVVSGSDMQGRLLQESLLDEVISFEKDDFLHPEDSQEYQKQQKIKKQIEQQKSQHQSASDLKKTLHSHSNPESVKALLPKQTDTSSDSAIAEIDVLILYTPDVDTLYSGDPLTRINHLVAVTNQIYVDSGVQIHLNAVAVDLVNYTENVFSDAALRDMTYQQKAFENVSIRRYEVGADMVILLRPYVDGDDACGIAWANGSNGSVKNSKRLMFSHTSIDCGDYVMAHELGHNMGLMHSRRQNGSGATFPFALGHGVDNEFTTVMAYQGVFSASKTYKFSNSSLDCAGFPCGID